MRQRYFMGFTLALAVSPFVLIRPTAGYEPAKPQPSEKPKIADDPLRSSRAWDEERAAHLLRRAGFGGTPDEIARLKKMGRESAVNLLINYDETKWPGIPFEMPEGAGPRRAALNAGSREERQKLIADARKTDRFLFERVGAWWIETMATSPRPLEEKLVLFWHGHFTSGYREVKSARAMYRQNQTLRKNASGNFREFLLDITEDPAMILYLNTQQNKKNKPNENYARELMELFTMGAGHYTEKDIKEAARAFTGITIDPETGNAFYRSRQHDFGEKTFLGVTGKLEPADIIDTILKQPVTAEYIARKLWSFFAYENPDEQLVKALAGVFRESNYELKPLLRAMFMCDAFYSARARFTNIKSPVELLVGTLRMLEIKPEDAGAMNVGLRMMGQSLMQPPNVKGWDGGATWITSSTLYNRYNVLGALIAGNDNPQARRRRERIMEMMRENVGNEAMMMSDGGAYRSQPAYDPAPTLEAYRLVTPEKLVDHYIHRLLQRQLKPERRKVLLDAITPNFGGRNKKAPTNPELIRGLIHLILSMPEYQLS